MTKRRRLPSTGRTPRKRKTTDPEGVPVRSAISNIVSRPDAVSSRKPSIPGSTPTIPEWEPEPTIVGVDIEDFVTDAGSPDIDTGKIEAKNSAENLSVEEDLSPTDKHKHTHDRSNHPEDDDAEEDLAIPDDDTQPSVLIKDNLPPDEALALTDPKDLKLANDDKTTQAASSNDNDLETRPAGAPNIITLRAPLIGRDEQLQQLKDIFLHTWNEGTVGLATLIGEPGAGKTRVAREFARSVRAAIPEARVLWGTAIDPQGQPYEAIHGALAERFGVGRAESPEDVRRKISAAVAESLPDALHAEVTHLLAHMMGVPFPDSTVVDAYGKDVPDLDLRSQIAVRRFLEQQASAGPLILCFDALENAHPDTVHLLHYLAESMRNHPVLILIAAQPALVERFPNWGRGTDYRRIDVPPLNAKEATALFQSLTNLSQVPVDVTTIVHDDLHGSPRAIHDFARLLVEMKLLRPSSSDKKWTIVGDRKGLQQLPRTHVDVLRARLRTLPEPERTLLGQAAVYGETFRRDALIALTRSSFLSQKQPDGPTLDQIAQRGQKAAEQFQHLLERLCQRDLVLDVSVSKLVGDREYRFCYPPIRKLGYELLKSSLAEAAEDNEILRNYHRTAAQWFSLRENGKNRKSQQTIGGQLEAAGDLRGAAICYHRAADIAKTRNDLTDAKTLLKQAIACIADSDVGIRLSLWHALGDIHVALGDFDSALDAFERMLRLAWVTSSRLVLSEAFNKLGQTWRNKGNLDLAYEHLQQSLTFAREINSQPMIAANLDDIAQIHWLVGKFDLALDRVGTALEFRRELNDKRNIAQSLVTIGRIERDRGLVEPAESCLREALSLFKETGDPIGHLGCRIELGTIEQIRGQSEFAQQTWESALREAKRVGAKQYEARTKTRLAELSNDNNVLDAAHKYVAEAKALAKEIGDRILYMDALLLHGIITHRRGDPDRARKYLETCRSLADSNDILPPDVPSLLPLLGASELALGILNAATLFDASEQKDTATPAEDNYRTAVNIFRQMGASAKLVHTLKLLGDCLLEREQLEEGREILRNALDIAKRLDLPERRSIDKQLREL